MADVAAALADWSTTASSNAPTDATTIGAGLADNFQQIQATVRAGLASKGADIASATTTDLGAVTGHQHDITGTTTITGFGTVAAGIWKIIKFEGALTLTHNATSLILPGGANITTSDGDVAIMVSEGSGNWRCASYQFSGGIVKSVRGVTGSIATATPTTIFAPVADGTYLISARIAGSSTSVYTASAVLNTEGSSARITSDNGANLTITLSGNNVQVTQTSGSNAVVNWSYIINR